MGLFLGAAQMVYVHLKCIVRCWHGTFSTFMESKELVPVSQEPDLDNAVPCMQNTLAVAILLMELCNGIFAWMKKV